MVNSSLRTGSQNDKVCGEHKAIENLSKFHLELPTRHLLDEHIGSEAALPGLGSFSVPRFPKCERGMKSSGSAVPMHKNSLEQRPVLKLLAMNNALFCFFFPFL